MKVNTQRTIDRTIGTIICRMLSLFYRMFKKESNSGETKKILIILLSEMGALVLANPMFQRLKEKFPGVELHVMLFEKNREVLELLGTIPAKNILIINDKSMPAFIKDTLNVLFAVRKINFDTVIDCELFSRISSILAFLSGAAVRVGPYPGGAIPRKFYEPARTLQSLLSYFPAISYPGRRY
jgi:ADP-heptose:LPS heptosyltransferase